MDCEAEDDLVLRSVYFPEALDDQVRARASRLGKSSGDLIRELVRVGLEREGADGGTSEARRPSFTPEPISPERIKASINPDYLVSFINGKPYKTLKRHLHMNGLDASTYRKKFGLPSDYPMVAKTYAAKRSELARTLGLGTAKTRPVEGAADETQKHGSKRRVRRSQGEAA
ncbi:MucR family transcriptional regulator [Methylobacterium sp. 391_Methyba4]|jgi:predicted transcriptional regulator|uniref:MucR family transcriptional regulator n=1 Tax=Methylobacterium sp. 391_Methyba4 TaxID=3038924 RepID=UPI001D3A8918|nr:MucR family transcriptional regulator [Methylobacterium sp. 391_Methyba4]MBY0254129.1 MucR family transcriptional regulator [Methylobacterium organophilum]WFS09601.1 MucR family transcriptional regulator [Methylobacterium sp. 391_Methyba4]